MKNVKTVPRAPAFRIPVHGMTLHGWAVQYVSGMEETKHKPGDYLTEWVEDRSGFATLNFESEWHMVFSVESEAKRVSELLRLNAEIETKVVRIG